MDRNKAISFMHDLMRMIVSKDGSDLFITAGSPPAMKIDGKVSIVSKQSLSSSHTQMLARSIMNDKQVSEFEEKQECNFSISLTGVARFRVNAFVQRGSTGLVLRIINSEIPGFAELNLPDTLQDIAMTKRGLVMFVGGTGSGKSTSLASMVDYRNQHSHGHIITIEDPVEFIHEHGNCLVTQREVGVDTDTYEIALKNTLRQAPDVILIGEVRDRETMEHAIAFAETGHLCLTTLHANSTNQALDRIINFFPDERRSQLLMDLSLNLKGLISQRLIPYMGKTGRIDVHEIKTLISKSNEAGMQTFDQALYDLFEAKKITFEDALRNADSINDIRLRIKLYSETAKKSGVADDERDFEMMEDDEKKRSGMI
jgi:twitching motility protein PilU